MPQPISSSLMSRYVPNAEDSQWFQLSKMKKCEVNRKKGECRGCRSNPRNFAMIAKISLGLRKFRNHSENFAILAKLGNFARLAKFR